MDHFEYKGCTYLIAFNPIGKDKRQYVIRRKKPCINFIVSDREEDRERGAASISYNKKNYHLLIDRNFDPDVSENKHKRACENAAFWYLEYLKWRDKRYTKK